MSQRTKNSKTQVKTRAASKTSASTPLSPEQLDRVIIISMRPYEESQALLSGPNNVEHYRVQDTGKRLIVTQSVFQNGIFQSQKQVQFSGKSLIGLEVYFYHAFQKIAGHGFIIYEHHTQLFATVQNVILSSRLPYVIKINNDVNFNWQQHHFVAAARLRFTFDEVMKLAWQKRMVYSCKTITPKDILKTLKACARRERFTPPMTKSTRSQKQNFLLVSYYMPPAETVAVHRLSYWHQVLPKIAKTKGDNVNVSVLTAIESYENDTRYLVVPDRANFNEVDKQTQDLVRECQASKVNYFSAHWAYYVKQYFEQRPHLRFDSIVISGNPFFYFELSEYFKEKWGATVVLDFRDPFANNPRFVYSKAHKELVCRLEDRYLKSADYAISVNKYCLDALRLPNAKMGRIVANGYDERIVDKISAKPLRKKSKKINFVYTGSFYQDRNPEPFLKALDEGKHSLIHIGKSTAVDAPFDKYSTIERYGQMPYSDVVGYCKTMDAGVIFTSGKAFEQTTKIFDYIATGIDIILVTDGVIHTGELENLTKNLGGVYWVKNKPSAISSFLKTYKPNKKTRKIATQFSRLKQTEALYKLLSNTK